MKICSNCKKQLPDIANFCTDCGSNQLEAVFAQPETEQKIPSATINPQPVYIVQTAAPAQSKTAGFPLSIVGLCLFWIPFVGAILGILGLIFSSIAKSKNNRSGATAGLVMSIIAVVLGLLVTFAALTDEPADGFAPQAPYEYQSGLTASDDIGYLN